MRHRVGHRKLGRKTEHRISLLRNLTTGLIIHERIETTLAKAKELRPFAERLITLGKRETLHSRRLALQMVPREDAVRKVFDKLSARFSDRSGGYTRILKLGPRRGDGTPMAFIELVDYKFVPTAADAKGKKEKSESAGKAKTKLAQDKADKKAKAKFDQPKKAKSAKSRSSSGAKKGG